MKSSDRLFSDHAEIRETLNGSKKLIIAIAGFSYSLDFPLFYYLSHHLDELSSDLVQIDLVYSKNPDFLEMDEAQLDKVFFLISEYWNRYCPNIPTMN